MTEKNMTWFYDILLPKLCITLKLRIITHKWYISFYIISSHWKISFILRDHYMEISALKIHCLRTSYSFLTETHIFTSIYCENMQDIHYSRSVQKMYFTRGVWKDGSVIWW